MDGGVGSIYLVRNRGLRDYGAEVRGRRGGDRGNWSLRDHLRMDEMLFLTGDAAHWCNELLMYLDGPCSFVDPLALMSFSSILPPKQQGEVERSPHKLSFVAVDGVGVGVGRDIVGF